MQFNFFFMVRLLTKYGAAVSLLVLVMWTSWARGGSAPGYFWALPWLALGVCEMMLLLTPRKDDEIPTKSAGRMLGELPRDPVFWLGLVLNLFLFIQWRNGPRETVYDVLYDIWRFTDPPSPLLPSCVDRAEGLQLFLWGLTVWVILMAMRHAVSAAGKLWLLRAMVVNGALLAVLGIAQYFTSDGKLFWYKPMEVFFFSTFGYPNHAGAYFTLMTGLNIGLVLEALGETRSRPHVSWLAAALLLNILGAMFSLSRAGILLTIALLIFGALYGLFWICTHLTAAQRLCVFGAVAGAAIIFCAVLSASPKNEIVTELASIETLESFEKSLVADRPILAKSAFEIWKDNPWYGVGGWGFRSALALYVPEDMWDYIRESPGRANVHNDLLQFLCEHGIVGLSLILAICVFLSIAYWEALRDVRRGRNRRGRARSWLGSVTPTAVCGGLALSATVVHSFIDLPFRSIAIISAWFIIFAALPALIPVDPYIKAQRIKRREEAKARQDALDLQLDDESAPAPERRRAYHHHHHGEER